MSYIGTEPKDIRSFGRTKFDYTATQGQTAFTGADDDGKVLAFTVGQIEVYVNGILMDDSDFTTTGTGTVTLASAANLNDVVNVVSFETNIPDSNYVPATGGTFTGSLTTGALTVGGAVTVNNNHVNIDSGYSYQWGDSHERIEQSDGKIEFFTNNSEQMTLSGSSLGIGTTTPYKPLTISSAIGGTKSDILDIQSSTAGGGTQPMVRFGTEANNNNTLGRIGFVDIPNYGGGFVVETNSSGAATHTTTEKFRIDKDGRVSAPNQPLFRASHNTTTSYPGSSSVVVYNSTLENRGNCYNTSNGKFTAPITGTYAFSFAHYTNNNSQPMVDLRKNGSGSLGRTEMRINPGLNSIVSSGMIIAPLSANDYVEVVSVDSSGGIAKLIGSSGWWYNYFNGHLIG